MLYKNLLYTSLTPSLFIEVSELSQEGSCICVLRSCYTVKQVSRYLYHATFCIMILVSLHTKSSIMFHAEFVYKLFPPKWRILTMKTLSYKLRRLSICSFDQIISLLFPPFQSCFIYHVLTMCFYLLML